MSNVAPTPEPVRTWVRRRVPAVVALAGLALVSAACGANAEGGSTTTTTTAGSTTTAAATTAVPSTASTTTAPATTTTVAPVPAPLTGAPAPDPEVLDRPALVVKIDNHPSANPQSGLNLADIVYEEEVEGISRLLAIFHSQASSPVGPIRSGRTSDIDIMGALGTPLFAWSGGNAKVTAAIRNADLVDVGFATSSGPGGYYRERTRSAPHNLYADGEKLFALARPEQNAPQPLFTYRAPGEATALGRPVAGVDFAISGTRGGWRWDAASASWQRLQDGKPHMTLGGERVSAANVVVQFTTYRTSPADPKSPEAVTVGTGEAWVFVDGRVVEGTWTRASAQAPTVLETDDGQVIALSPGRTWVELPRSAKATVVEG